MPDPDAKKEDPPVLGYARPVANRSFQEALTEFVVRETEENLKTPPRESHSFRREMRLFIAIGFLIVGAIIAISALIGLALKR